MEATKQEEREALEQIKRIVENLGPNSYVKTALDGCFEVAESNIENDFELSISQRAKALADELEQTKADLRHEQYEHKEALKEIERMSKHLEDEEEWMPYEGDGFGTNMRQEDYKNLEHCCRETEEFDAKGYLAEEFGFDPARIEILYHVETFEINRHMRTRSSGVYLRRPLYFSSDWNYIRFDCAAYCYELVNGELKSYCY